MTIDEMRRELQRRLKKERFAHSIGVANTAVKLAKKFGVDENKAYIAGLLHDCARQFENNELPAEAQKRGIKIGEVENSMPLLLHSYIGAKMIDEIYGVNDKEIEQAIYRHTVGARDMSPLDKIIYFADMIEPNRNYPGVDELRNFAANSDNLDEIILKALDESIIFVVQKKSLVHPDTIDARNFLLLQKEIFGQMKICRLNLFTFILLKVFNRKMLQKFGYLRQEELYFATTIQKFLPML